MPLKKITREHNNSEIDACNPIAKSPVEDRKIWVADGTRTRNNQNHNLELYH
jgi:hypothetical protein